MANRKRRKHKRIHLDFRAHTPDEAYCVSGIRKDMDFHLMESDRPFNPNKKASVPTHFTETEHEYLQRVLESGKRAVPAEAGTPADAEKLRSAWSRRKDLAWDAGVHPSVENIRAYYIGSAQYTALRHELIKRTIEAELKKGRGQGRFGTFHSILSSELKAMGIDSSREIRPQVFLPGSRLSRKLMAGADPKRIPDMEYKRAWVSNRYSAMAMDFLNESWFGSTRRYRNQFNDKEYRFYSLVISTMIDRLTAKQLDALIKVDNWVPLFESNGFEDPKNNPPVKAPADWFSAKTLQFLEEADCQKCG